MPEFRYGQTQFAWRFQPDDELKRHYVTVERGQPVLLRGPRIEAAEQEALIRRRARWIREKLAQVNLPSASEMVVTGSRLRYAGRTYFTEIRHVPGIGQPALHFTASRFIIDHPDGTSIPHAVLMPLLEYFYQGRAKDRLVARVRHWERQTGLHAAGIRIRHFQSRWASCDTHNVLQFHPRVMELPATVLDYVIVHELCHTIEKGHTKVFWNLVARHMPEWERQHAVLERAAFGNAI